MNSHKKNLPQLYPLKKEIEKTWYVEYLGKDGKRKKVYGKLNHLPTVQQRLKEADFLINSIISSDLQLPKNGAGNQLIHDLQEVFNLKAEYWSSKTISAYQTHFYTFARWYRQNGCPELTALQALKFLNTVSKEAIATTRNNYRNNLKTLFGLLCRYHKHRYKDNPFADVDTVPETRKTKEWFRPGTMQKAIEVISSDRQLFLSCKIMFHCFARPNEMRQLRCADIITETKKLRIESIVAKTKRIRFVPIPDCLFAELSSYTKFPANWYLFTKDGLPGEQRMGRDFLSKQHKKTIKQLSLGNRYTYYSWKNTGAVKMLMQDKRNIRYISKCMGHHSLDMTDKYFESLGVDEMGERILFPNM